MATELSLQDLLEFIQHTQDARELKRALAVKMTLQGTLQKEIMSLLQVTSGFISKWKGIYERQGAEALRLGYQGGVGYLSEAEQQAVLEWLQQKDYWHLEDLQRHLWQTYQVEFRSRQSYYDLMARAGLSWKKSQNVNPKHDEAAVDAKKLRSNESCTSTEWNWSRERCER
jgi:putative transposase